MPAKPNSTLIAIRVCFRYGLLLSAVTFITSLSFAQDDSARRPPRFTVKGYLKYLDQASFAGSATQLETNELIHNRLNFRYDPDPHFKIRLEIRNRLYYGELVQNYPNFASLVTASSGTFDLSKNWVNQNSVLFNSTIDRASIEYTAGKWDITLGRQRINWAINTVWSPNDIFNTFNYFDFDYEERPGSDAARIQYVLNASSSLEVDASPGSTSAQNIGAMMYHTNKWGYDFQLYSGVYHHDFTAGAGWAGNIKSAGFKGEIACFTPYGNTTDSAALVASVSLDYGFKNGIYVLVSGLYNSPGKDSLINIAQLTTETLSAKNIFPFRYTMFAQVSYGFTPIFKASFASMYSPAGNSFIILPSVTYSISNNWVLDIIAQSFFSQQNNEYQPLGTSVYFRIKWGF